MTPYVWVAVSLQAAPQEQPPHLPLSLAPFPTPPRLYKVRVGRGSAAATVFHPEDG